jgi:hypothetical protein
LKSTITGTVVQMPSKDKMIAELRRLAASLESGDLELGDDDLPKLLFPLSLFLAPHIYEIEQKLDRLLERPSRVECRLSEADGDSFIQFIVKQTAPGVRYLNECLSGAVELTICDPYFLTASSKTPPGNYVGRIEAVLPATLKRLEIFVATDKKIKRNKTVADGINSLCKRRNIKLSCMKTDEIHDRVWIANHLHAYVVGTSFNSLGDKCAFILELPDEDRRLFIQEITSLRGSLPKSKSA